MKQTGSNLYGGAAGNDSEDDDEEVKESDIVVDLERIKQYVLLIDHQNEEDLLDSL
jgi:hypothetical protein